MLRVVPCRCASLQTQRLRPTGGRKTPGLSECSLQYCLHSLFLSSGLHMSQFTDKGTPLPSAPLPPGAARPGVSCGVKLLGCPQSETNPPTQQRRLLPDPRLMAPPEAERFPAALDPGKKHEKHGCAPRTQRLCTARPGCGSGTPFGSIHLNQGLQRCSCVEIHVMALHKGLSKSLRQTILKDTFIFM